MAESCSLCRAGARSRIISPRRHSPGAGAVAVWRGCSMHAGRGPGRRARGGFRLCSASSGSFLVTRLTAGGLRRRASQPERGLTSPAGSRGRHRRYPQGSPLRVAAPDPAVTLLLCLRFEHGFESWKGFLARKEEKPTSRALRVAPSGAAFDATVLVFFGSAARARGAARRRAGCRPRGAEAFVTASHAAVAMLGRLALARCPVLARCPIQALNACSTASSVPWSSRVAKVPGRDPFGTATQGRGRVLAGGCALSGPPASSASESSRGAFRVYISIVALCHVGLSQL